MSFGFVAFVVHTTQPIKTYTMAALQQRNHMLPTGHVHSANVWLNSKLYNSLQRVSTAWQQAVEHVELQKVNLQAPCLLSRFVNLPLLCLKVYNVLRICLRVVKDSKDG